MNATRLSAEHRRILAEYLDVPLSELNKALAARTAAERYIAERMEREGHPFPRTFARDTAP